jgi:hypothetical protein
LAGTLFRSVVEHRVDSWLITLGCIARLQRESGRTQVPLLL